MAAMSSVQDAQFMNIALKTKAEFTEFDVDLHRLSETNTCYYIPNMITKNGEAELMDIIYNKLPKRLWVNMDHGRLICFDGKKDREPVFCHEICDGMMVANVPFNKKRKPNYILINEYEIGEGILPHQDGSLFDSLVAIISLYDIICLNFYHNKPFSNKGFIINHKPNHQIILEPRSCVIFTDKMYKNMFHCIHESNYDIILDSCLNLDIYNNNNKQKQLKIGDKLFRTKTRVSLSIRHVL